MKVIEKFIDFILNERKINPRADQKKHILTTLFLFAITGLTIGLTAGLTYGLFTRRINPNVLFLGGMGGSLLGILARIIIFLFKKRIPFIESVKSVDNPILIKSPKEIKEIILQVSPILKNFTTDVSLNEQKNAHSEAKKFLLDNLPSTGATVEIIRSPQLNNPSYEQVQIKNDLNKEIFCWEITHDVGEAIKEDGNRNASNLIVYGAASQFNGCEAPDVYTAKPGEACEVYSNDHSQGPIAQLQFPDHQVELINCAGNLGFNGLSDMLDNKTKNSVEHGYLIPDQDQLESLEKQLSSGTIEYINVANKPSNCLKEVHLILVSAFAWGRIFQIQGTKQVQFLCALHAYRAQFQQCIKLANENHLPVIFKPTAIGMGAYNNNPEMIAKAFYKAAKEFEKELVDSQVEVRLQVWKNRYWAENEFLKDKARTMVNHLLLDERKAL